MAITTGLSPKHYLINGQNGAVGILIKEYFKSIENINLSKDFISADVMLHLAASSRIENILSSNISYLNEVVQYCLKNDIKNLVFFSSVSIYGKQDKLNIQEDSVSIDLDLYASSKLFAEQYLKSIKDINILILRLPAILTKNSNTYISRILDDLKINKDIILYNYNEKFNSFTSTEDIARFINNYDFNKKFEVINFASEQNQTLRDVVEYLKDLLNSQSKITFDIEKKPYYNIAITKLVKDYSFTPLSYKHNLRNWVEFNNEK